MIITRKRFERIIREEANAAKKAERLEEKIRQQDGQIRSLRAKYYGLQERLGELEEKSEKGTIHGFYLAKPVGKTGDRMVEDPASCIVIAPVKERTSLEG